MNNELNKYLHENVMGECWHESADTARSSITCDKCGNSYGGGFRAFVPDYTTDLNAVRRVEEKVVERFGSVHYVWHLMEICKHEDKAVEQIWTAMATADQRSQACKNAHEQMA